MTIKLNRISQLFEDIFNKGFFHLLSANFIMGFLAFGAQLLVAKFLTPVELGQIKVMQSFIWLATILAGFGFNTAILKLCSEKKSREERSIIFTQNIYYTVIPIIFVLVILFLLAKLGLLSPDKAINNWLPVYMLVIPAMTYTALVMAYLQALKKIQIMAKMQMIIRLFSVIVLVFATYVYGLVGFIFSSIFILYISSGVLFSLVKSDFKIKRKLRAGFSKSFFYAKWSVAANIVTAIGQYMDILILNYFIEDRLNFGYYSLSVIFILGMNYITATVQAIATPYFSEKSNNKQEFLRVLKKYEKLMILLAFSVTMVAFLIVPLFINVLYGSAYKPAGIYFRILLFKYFFWSCYALPGVAMVGLGKMRYNFLSGFILVIISFILTYFFIIYYGIIGAAIAQALAYFISLIVVLLMTKYVISISFEARR